MLNFNIAKRYSYNNASRNTIINSLVAILLAIITLIFSFVRTSLTTFTFGVTSLGFLTIVLGILPYLNSSHGGINSVSAFNLYEPMNKIKTGGLYSFNDINKKIANLRPQYYLFGAIYTIIIFVIAFAFPFIFNNNGSFTNGIDVIEWYESTLFILANCFEMWVTFFVVPISIILLFIMNKSYIYNWINIVLTILFNVIIIVLFILIENKLINLNFIWMNIIIFCLFGFKLLLMLFILAFVRKSYFPWYEKIKPDSWKLTKDNFYIVISQYFNQFGTDLFSIAFIIYSAISLRESNSNISLYHGSHGGVASNGLGFDASAIFSVYLLLISSAREIVHSIIDASIPSLVEHMFKNNNKIDKHFFHRYQLLTTYTTCYTITTFLFTIAFSNSLFLDFSDHADGEHNHINLNPILSLGLCIPIFIESISSTYNHLLPVFGKFKKIMKINIIKAIINTLLLAIFATSICLTQKGFETNGLYLSIIISWSISLIYSYFSSRLVVIKYIWTRDGCINLGLRTFITYLYVFVSYVGLFPIFIIYANEINHTLETLNVYGNCLIVIAISIVNLFVCFFNLYIFRNDDVKYYIKEFNFKNKPMWRLL